MISVQRGSLGSARPQPSRGVRLRRAWGLLRPYGWRTLGAAGAIAAATAASLAPPYLAGRAIDDVINQGTTQQLDLIVGAMVVALMVGWAAGFAQTYLVGWVGQHALRDLRTRLFEHLQHLPVAFYDRNSTGLLISRMTNNVEALDQLVTDGVNALVSSIVTVAAATIVLFVLDPELALVTFGVIPLLAVGTLIYGRLSGPVFRSALNAVADVTTNMEESLAGGRVVRAFVQEERHRRDFDVVNAHNREVNWRAIRLISFYLPYVQLISILSVSIVAVYGGFQVIDGSQELGIVVSFIGYLRMALAPLPDIGGLYSTYQQGTAALDQSFELLEERSEIVEEPGAPDLPRLSGRVEFENVHFGYGPDRPVLRNASFSISAGETVAIVGPTGSGKSTLINLIPRFYDPQAGRVLVDGQDVRGVSVASLRRQIGLVPQEPLLFSGTVRENIAFARPDATAGEVSEAARSVGVLDALTALPDGLETEVGERGASLSAGQRQLVALARASLISPPLVILDEATASLDFATETQIGEALQRLLAGRTSLIVAHRLSTIRDADRIIVLVDGQIAENGTHDELLAEHGAYAELFRRWSESA